MLLVEDDASIADLYAMELGMDGYTVSIAADATTADVIFGQAAPDLVCVDSRLRGSSGLDRVQRYAAAGAIVVLLTNDQTSFEDPPAGVTQALLKSRTIPCQLSKTLAQLVAARRR